MSNCIFCKIINGEFRSAKVWENSNFLAILDINPNTKGMTLLLTKTHYDSYINDLPEDLYLRYFEAAKKVSKILEKGLNVKRVALVVEGLAINHAHIKLYPLHGLKNNFEELLAKEKIFFEKYEGYISTQLGPQRGMKELQILAEKIKERNKA